MCWRSVTSELTLLTGLHLHWAAFCISSIGICDISDKVTARWEFEKNQIAYPWAYDALPEVDVVKPEDLFKCDVLYLSLLKESRRLVLASRMCGCTSLKITPRSLRSMQDRRAEHFKGLFAVVSDPVDPLTKTAWLESNKDENGILDLKDSARTGAGPDSALNARAAYYAKRDGSFLIFDGGRSFGPHGRISSSQIPLQVQRRAFKELTQLTVTANLHMRAIRFQAVYRTGIFLGAISLILMMRGEWHCGSVFMGGIFMGVKNRYTEYGLETEILPLPDALYEQLL